MMCCTGGAIIPLWNHARRSSLHQLEDPITLVVAPNENVFYFTGVLFYIFFRMKRKEEYTLMTDSHMGGPSLMSITIVNFLYVLLLLAKEKPEPRNLLLKILKVIKQLLLMIFILDMK
jgi:hypothetical protein